MDVDQAVDMAVEYGLNDLARNPGKLTFSGSGKGTANHLAKITLDKLAGMLGAA